jgi:membrane protease YdiL (CAAX protease family)
MAYGMLPLTEVDLFILPCDVVATYPLLGTLCMGFVTPITISCLLYGSVFAPICYKRPVLAYVAMAAYLAFPRFCNAATFWDPATEWTLYFTQLPLHMIACWSYQKADSIWAPVLTHMIVNFFSALLILLTWVLPSL